MMGFKFHVTSRLAYMFVLASMLLLVFTFFFGLQMGQGLERESMAKQLGAADAGVSNNNALPVDSAVQQVSGAISHSKNALKIPKLPTAPSFQSGVTSVVIDR
jgi:hypothetical protein